MTKFEWHLLAKGSGGDGLPPLERDTWFVTIVGDNVLIGAVDRGGFLGFGDSWRFGFYIPDRDNVWLNRPSSLTLIEVKQVWEREYANAFAIK